MPMPNTPVDSATKAAIHSYSLVLRQQFLDSSVRVIKVVLPMVDTGLNRAGRDANNLKLRGINVSKYNPTIINGLENDKDIIFYCDREKIMNDLRGESESRLFNPSR